MQFSGDGTGFGTWVKSIDQSDESKLVAPSIENHQLRFLFVHNLDIEWHRSKWRAARPVRVGLVCRSKYMDGFMFVREENYKN